MDIYENIKDEDIVFMIQQGEKEKLSIIMDRYEKKLSRYARKFVSGADSIDDMVQDVFIKTYENIKSFDVERKFSPWIYRIAHNIFLNEIKKKKSISFNILNIDTVLPYHVSTDSADKDFLYNETKLLLEDSLENIPIKYKEILISYYMEELSYKEIVDVLKIPLGTVCIRIKRARCALIKYMPHDILE